MSDHELEKIKQRKVEMLLKQQSTPKEIINFHNINDLNQLTKKFPVQNVENHLKKMN